MISLDVYIEWLEKSSKLVHVENEAVRYLCQRKGFDERTATQIESITCVNFTFMEQVRRLSHEDRELLSVLGTRVDQHIEETYKTAMKQCSQQDVEKAVKVLRDAN